MEYKWVPIDNNPTVYSPDADVVKMSLKYYAAVYFSEVILYGTSP